MCREGVIAVVRSLFQESGGLLGKGRWFMNGAEREAGRW